MDNSIRASSFLGIECGGTRTTALLAPEGARECLRAEFGPANLHLLDDQSLTQHFTTIDTLRQDAHASLAGIAIGMAGARTDADRQRIRAAAAKVWPNVPCYATNDLETGLAAGDAGGLQQPAARVLILSGTGSCCLARTPSGATTRVGGWGHILGDDGSGYHIGLRALKSSVHHLDWTGRWPPLGQSILHALQLHEPEDLIDWTKNAAKPDIAALAVQVFQAAARRDKLAQGIVKAAAQSLACAAAHCARRLVPKGAPVAFLLGGSVLLQQPAFARHVRATLLNLWPGATVSLLRRESAWGALALAREHFGDGSPAPSVVKDVASDTTPLPAARALSPTEQRNPRSLTLDRLPVSKAVLLMIEEESTIAKALLKKRTHIERAVRMVVAAFRRGGRLFYVGAGTSGRLGILDAAECPPTFRTPPDRVQGIIAGGQAAVWRSVEGAEDSPRDGAAAIEYRGVNRRDLVIGIAASGRTPFVWGALAEAKARGARTMLLCFNPHLQFTPANRPDLVIAVDVGPEVLTGSTRLKAGTATKIILNTLTTLAMVRMGKVVSNLMVDLNASNSKLRQRAVRIVQAVTGAAAPAALAALEKSNWIVKTACQRLR
ncbi:MAG: N-acetylmuramic acid 6-phosphate etherase [Verrucomicrobiota bacterium]|jgi:N-acetylmuramic acid 6-phosphate etherase